jgi:hypothetical protein
MYINLFLSKWGFVTLNRGTPCRRADPHPEAQLKCTGKQNMLTLLVRESCRTGLQIRRRKCWKPGTRQDCNRAEMAA